MRPEIGTHLIKKFETTTTSAAPWRVIFASHENNLYTVRLYVTNETEDFSSEQLDLYFRLEY